MSIRLAVLMIANCIFYAILDIRALPVLVACAVITYISGRITFTLKEHGRVHASKYACLISVFLLTAVLCIFKYVHGLKQPVGMSFYMLMAISFIADCYRGEFDKLPSVLETCAYISFFPTVISGPIMKAKDMIPQIKRPAKFTKERLGDGLWLIAIGLFMKFAVADRLAVSVDKVYSAPLCYSGLTLFFTSIGYTLQLLFDFAGYSYMAVGGAKIIGFDIMRNFNLPYIAQNPSEFWRRWHISLSQWLRDYVYIPLGGNRKGNIRTYVNIFLVMTVSGLWHGNTVNFLIWGMLHGIGQIVYRFMSKRSGQKKDAKQHLRIFSMILNFLFVSFLWIPFRVPTLHDTWIIIRGIFTLQKGASYYYVYTFAAAAILVVIEFIGSRYNDGDDPIRPLPLSKTYAKLLFVMLLLATAMFAYFGSGAFIYAQF